MWIISIHLLLLLIIIIKIVVVGGGGVAAAAAVALGLAFLTLAAAVVLLALAALGHWPCSAFFAFGARPLSFVGGGACPIASGVPPPEAFPCLQCRSRPPEAFPRSRWQS